MFFVSALKAKDNDDSVDHLFELDNANLTNGKYSAALQGYQKLEQMGNHSAGLYTNMGDAYFRVHQFGKSVLYFEKGLLLAPMDINLIHNREKALLRLNDTVRVNNLSIALKKTNFYKLIDGLNITATIILILSGLAFIISTVMFISQYTLNIVKISRIIATVSFLAIILLSITLRIYQSKKYAIIILPKSTVNIGPSSHSKIMHNFNEGYEVELINSYGDWFEVKDFQGNTGWVSRDKLVEIQ